MIVMIVVVVVDEQLRIVSSPPTSHMVRVAMMGGWWGVQDLQFVESLVSIQLQRHQGPHQVGIETLTAVLIQDGGGVGSELRGWLGHGVGDSSSRWGAILVALLRWLDLLGRWLQLDRVLLGWVYVGILVRGYTLFAMICIQKLFF